MKSVFVIVDEPEAVNVHGVHKSVAITTLRYHQSGFSAVTTAGLITNRLETVSLSKSLCEGGRAFSKTPIKQSGIALASQEETVS